MLDGATFLGDRPGASRERGRLCKTVCVLEIYGLERESDRFGSLWHQSLRRASSQIVPAHVPGWPPKSTPLQKLHDFVIVQEPVL